jgi:hypothetical protein
MPTAPPPASERTRMDIDAGENFDEGHTQTSLPPEFEAELAAHRMPTPPQHKYREPTKAKQPAHAPTRSPDPKKQPIAQEAERDAKPKRNVVDGALNPAIRALAAHKIPAGTMTFDGEASAQEQASSVAFHPPNYGGESTNQTNVLPASPTIPAPEEIVPREDDLFLSAAKPATRTAEPVQERKSPMHALPIGLPEFRPMIETMDHFEPEDGGFIPDGDLMWKPGASVIASVSDFQGAEDPSARNQNYGHNYAGASAPNPYAQAQPTYGGSSAARNPSMHDAFADATYATPPSKGVKLGPLRISLPALIGVALGFVLVLAAAVAMALW